MGHNVSRQLDVSIQAAPYGELMQAGTNSMLHHGYQQDPCLSKELTACQQQNGASNRST
jgi:hypothetical protein